MSKADRLAAVLDSFLEIAAETEAAAVVSGDGLPMASALPAHVEEDRLAAMSAALLTLGERAAEGLGRGQLSQVFIEGRDGYVVLMAAGPDAVLVAITSKRAKVGLALFEMRRAAARIAEVMAASIEVSPVLAEQRPSVTPAEAAIGDAMPPPPPAPDDRRGGDERGSDLADAPFASWQ